MCLDLRMINNVILIICGVAIIKFFVENMVFDQKLLPIQRPFKEQLLDAFIIAVICSICSYVVYRMKIFIIQILERIIENKKI
jgi:hypothetical protein